MSEAAEATNENDAAGTPADAPETDAEGEAQTNSEDGKAGRPAYQPRVDLDTLPADIRAPIEARFKHLSWTMRQTTEKLSDWQKLAAEQSEQIEKLTNGFGKVAAHLEDKTYADTEAQLANKANEAWDAGDTKTYHQANRELQDLRVKKGIADALAEKDNAQPKKEAAKPSPVESEANTSPAAAAWQDETSDTGDLVRPWAHHGDDGYADARGHLLAIQLNPRMQTYTESQIMQELDRRMGVTKAASRQQVMGANLTRGSKAAKVSLSPKQEEVATRMKLGGPKATRDQHIDAYRKQLADMKGARQ